MRPDRHARGRKYRRRGVVLLDVILALAVLALAALALMPRPRSGVAATELQAEAIRVAASFRQGRATALRSQRPVDIFVDPDRRSVTIADGPSIAIRDGIDMVWVTSDQCPARGGVRALRYLSDGRSCGGVLTLSAGGGNVRLRVDWLTGRVDMSAV